MASETFVILTIVVSLLLAAVAIFVYGRIEFQTLYSERALIRSGILLFPLYAMLEFGAFPESSLPVVVLFGTGAVLAYAFQVFEEEVPEDSVLKDVAEESAVEEVAEDSTFKEVAKDSTVEEVDEE